MRTPPRYKWFEWTSEVFRPPRNRPILAYFPPYGFRTIEFTARQQWRCVCTGALILHEFPTHWTENPEWPTDDRRGKV